MPEAGAPDRLRVLLVDDNAEDRTLALRALQREHPSIEAIQPTAAESLAAALAAGDFDLVVTDYSLRWSDGLAVTRAVKARAPLCPVVMYTGTGNEQVAVAAMKLGVDDYVLKSASPTALAVAVRGALAHATERRLRRGLEHQLLQAQKMESVGRLAGGIAHDFNNILTAILGYADLLLEDMPEARWRADIGEIKRSAERAALLTRQLLAFGRRQILMPQVVDVNALVADLERMLGRLIGEHIALSTSLSEDLHLLRVDPGQLTQAIMNLVVNARDAMPNGGKLTIETRNVQLDETYAATRDDVAPGDYVMIAVSDTGVGMDATVIARLFEPFFTTKERGQGTGLGLSTAYGIVKQSGGHIAVYSEPKRGSTFRIYLPPTNELLVPAPAPRPPPRGGGETVLLVEDEEAVRALARRVLTGHGYVVLEAATAEEGQSLWREHQAGIALVLTDVVLPGASGPELVRVLRDDRPDLRILYTSGYTEAAIIRRGVLDPNTPYLQKPFAPTALAHKVREVLDA